MTSACSKAKVSPGTDTGSDGPDQNPPHTSIPAQLVGTWYRSDNNQPLTVDWQTGTFQGEAGFKEFRTMVFTANGLNATEYYSEVFVSGSSTLNYLYKLTGTLEYSASSSKLQFHAISGKMRIFKSGTSGYTEKDITASDIARYYSVLTNVQAADGVINAQRFDGGNSWSVKYLKVNGNENGGGNGTPGDAYSTPPGTGTYVKIGNKYFPTITIGNHEWTSVNYYGDGAMNVADKIHYGTFYRFTDLNQIPVPAGWRIANLADYKSLLASQNIPFDEVWNSTDGSDLESKKKLGHLMATTGWLKQDGYEDNTSKFGAVPANIKVSTGTANGEGTNCVLWTGEKDGNNDPIAFKIIQMPSDTYATFSSYSEGYNPVYAPVRLVRNK
jgi:uncharacterized protein (TIGR02145 family)